MKNSFITILQTLATEGNTSLKQLMLLTDIPESEFLVNLKSIVDMNLAKTNGGWYDSISISSEGYAWLKNLKASRKKDEYSYNVEGLVDLLKYIHTKYRVGELISSNNLPEESTKWDVYFGLKKLASLGYLLKHEEESDNIIWITYSINPDKEIPY